MTSASKWSGLVDSSGNRIPSPNHRKRIDAHYDLLKKWDDDDRWKYATHLSSDALDNYENLRKIRSAARLEFRNNPYVRSMLFKFIHEIVGTGPKLEIVPKERTEDRVTAAKTLKRYWDDYASEIRLTDKLMLALTEEMVGGEAFCVFRPNLAISTLPIDFEVYEADQFHTPNLYLDRFLSERSEYPLVDGITLDRWGNPMIYHRLKNHPGSDFSAINLKSGGPITIEVDPEVCVHLFRKERPTQYRGVSHLLPVLPVFSGLRRYTEATLTTAERQANIAGSMETGFTPDDCADVGSDPMYITVGGGTFVNLPDGWKLNPFDHTQPTQGYAEVKKEFLHEAQQAFLLPWNIAMSDSSEYNFASGRLDYIIFYHIVDYVRTQQLEKRLLDRFFGYWIDFANDVGRLPSRLGSFTHKWYWDEREPIDKEKDANAIKSLREAEAFDEVEYWECQGKNPFETVTRNLELQKHREAEKKRLGIKDEAEKQAEQKTRADQKVRSQNGSNRSNSQSQQARG